MQTAAYADVTQWNPDNSRHSGYKQGKKTLGQGVQPTTNVQKELQNREDYNFLTVSKKKGGQLPSVKSLPLFHFKNP